jgi:hypothetical protein
MKRSTSVVIAELTTLDYNTDIKHCTEKGKTLPWEPWL